MDLVIDANILFAALIKNGETARLLLHDGLHLFAPEFLLEELEKYNGTILAKTYRTQVRFDEVLTIFKNRITFIPMEDINKVLPEAESFAPDINDSPYLGASLLTGAGLWTNDSKLAGQNRVRVYSTKDLISLFP